MATLATANPTLADVVGRLGPKGNIEAQVVELMNLTDESAQDRTYIEANDRTSHLTTVRTGLPTVAWRKLYKGVPASKSKTAQVRDTLGMMAARAQIDAKLAELNGWSAAWRLSEESTFVEAMNQELAKTIWYGNSVIEGEKFMGLAPRFSDLNAESGHNIINAGGTGNNLTSIWLTCWGPQTLFMIYPSGSAGGLKIEDKGKQMVPDEDGNLYDALVTMYSMDAGLVLRDWRYVVRIANIDVSAISANTDDGLAAAKSLFRLMTKAKNRLPSTGMGRVTWNMNRDVLDALEIAAQHLDNVQMSVTEGVNGFPVTRIKGFPVRRCDAILSTESQVQ